MVMMGSEIVLGAAAVVHAISRSLEGMISLREVMRTLGMVEIRGFEKVKVLWLDHDDAASGLTEGKPGVGSLSALVALAGMFELVGTAVTGMLVCGIVLIS